MAGTLRLWSGIQPKGRIPGLMLREGLESPACTEGDDALSSDSQTELCELKENFSVFSVIIFMLLNYNFDF